jgi:transposase-like protein
MRTYPEELKAKIIARLLPPNNEYIPDVAKETGIPKDTLYAWRIGRRRGNPVVESGPACTMTGAEKFDIVLETAGMNEAELSEYCRRNGLYPEQIRSWRETCRRANTRASVHNNREKNRQLSQENKQLKAELRRKEKARNRVLGFAKWYNELYRHGALKFVTPAQRHGRQDIAILERRKQLYLTARAKHPHRWSGPIRNWQPDNVVCLNPKKSDRPKSKAA